MSDDDYPFVDRPIPRAGPGDGLTQRLIETATNGQAIEVPKHCAGYSPYLRLKGYRLRQTKRGAREGYVFAWAEKLPETKA